MDSTSAAHRAPCPLCARPRTEADARGLDWSSEHRPDGSVRWVCGPCTRAQLWRIEAMLAPEAAETTHAA